MSKKYYIYKMYNNKDELLYIGKTHNLYARMNAHFSNAILNEQPWKQEVNKIEVIELYNQYDIDIIEIYLIGKEKPKYNSDKVYENASPSFNINYKIKNKFIINNPLNVKFKNKKDTKKKTTNTSKQGKREEINRKEKYICPECNYYSVYNILGLGVKIENNIRVKFERFKCGKCGCEWEVKINE